MQEIKSYLQDLQLRVCAFLEAEESTARFVETAWERKEGGGGITRALEGGSVIEKCGVNFSHVWGDRLPFAATAHRGMLEDRGFEAMGLSIIVHPLNPYAPTTHMNLRFFSATAFGAEPVWWFGGGFDLTPYYGFEEDCVHWHRMAKKACEPFGKEIYPRYKKWADEYFYLKHRQESRGIGGLFFDDLSEGGFEKCFAFMKSVGEHFILAYQPLLAQRKNMLYGQREKDFQHYRRGRYVEFNLLYDRGTLFGLQSGGRTESILISLPPQVSWHYDWHPEKNSLEAALYEKFLKPKEWV